MGSEGQLVNMAHLRSLVEYETKPEWRRYDRELGELARLSIQNRLNTIRAEVLSGDPNDDENCSTERAKLLSFYRLYLNFYSSPKRDWIVKVTSARRMKPEKADQIAKRRNWAPFQKQPPLDMDPMAVSTWSLPMALTWIASRSTQDVKRSWDKSRALTFGWHPAENPTLLEYGPEKVANFQTIRDILSETSSRPPERPPRAGDHIYSLDEAYYELADNARLNTLSVAGLRTNHHKIIVIPSHEWLCLQMADDKNDLPTLIHKSTGVDGYTQVVVAQKDILSLWPRRTSEWSVSNENIKSASALRLENLDKVPPKQKAVLKAFFEVFSDGDEDLLLSIGEREIKIREFMVKKGVKHPPSPKTFQRALLRLKR
jgi:hypothetical protein